MRVSTFTNDDFINFKFSVLAWMDKLGITGWDVTFIHDQIGDGVAAQVQYNPVKRNCAFRLTINREGDYGMDVTTDELALHEVLHLLVGPLLHAASELKDNHEIAIGYEHELIGRLMPALMGKKQ